MKRNTGQSTLKRQEHSSSTRTIKMKDWTRRGFAVAAASMLWTGALAQSRKEQFDQIDRRIDSALAYMLNTIPDSQDLLARSAGMLMMPVVTKAGIGLGGAYGEGALRIKNETVDYYSSVQVNYGLQLGASQYSYALFFMNDQALSAFRKRTSWHFGAELGYVVVRDALSDGVDTATRLADVVALVFGEAGLHLGAALEGTIYSRLEQ